MELIWQGLRDAVDLLIHVDQQVLDAAVRTIAGTARSMGIETEGVE